MGWLQRLFGINKDEATTAPAGTSGGGGGGTAEAATEGRRGTSVAPERMGLNGEYDQSGLAKRVALALDQDPQIDDIETLWVAQTGSTVVLKGKVPDQQILSRIVELARGVSGATAVESDQVTIGT